MLLNVKPVLMAGFVSALCASSAHSVLTISDVTLSGGLETGATYTINNERLDVSFPDASAGDHSGTPHGSRRFGVLTITYILNSTDPLTPLQFQFTAQGELTGKGQIFFNQVIEDLIVLGTIATDNITFTSTNQFPFTVTPNLSRATRSAKVKQSFTFTAQDSTDPNVMDVAKLTSLGQRVVIVPEPGVITALLIGGAGLLGFRKRR